MRYNFIAHVSHFVRGLNCRLYFLFQYATMVFIPKLTYFFAIAFYFHPMLPSHSNRDNSKIILSEECLGVISEVIILIYLCILPSF